jgi:hypothetical protein
MDEMGKMMQTVPVVLEDEGYTGGWFILYVANEGEVFQTLPMRCEDEADKFMHEYERTGLMTMHNPLTIRFETLEPVFMLKAQATKAVRKQWRYVEVQNDKIIEG